MKLPYEEMNTCVGEMMDIIEHRGKPTMVRRRVYKETALVRAPRSTSKDVGSALDTNPTPLCMHFMGTGNPYRMLAGLIWTQSDPPWTKGRHPDG